MVNLILVFTLHLASIATSREVIPPVEECPLWTIHSNGTCVCPNSLNQIVKCDPLTKGISIKFFHCMTANFNSNPVVGACLYHHYEKSLIPPFDKIHANSTANINEEMCGVYNRKGLMCGQCIKDYGFPVYSYRVDCVECVDYKYNWLKYIAVAYLPLTVFLLVIVIFKISANSGMLVGYVTVSQMMATYSLAQAYFSFIDPSRYTLQLISAFYSIWNLDFFRVFEQLSFCLHPNMPFLGILSLDYLVAIYPMAAVIFTYTIVQKCSSISFLARPLNKCLHLFKREWNVGSSLIEAFATLILLSQVKILNVTFNILTLTYFYDINGTHGFAHVYNDPHTVYLSKQHLPYFVLAIAMSFVFNFLPFLLICSYPCVCFQKFLNWTRLGHPALSIFMDAFHGGYKHKPFYLRSFPAIYMMAQLTNLLIFSSLGFEYYHAAASLMLIVIIILLTIGRPYRNKWHSVITVSLFSAIFIFYISLVIGLSHKILLTAWFIFLYFSTWFGILVPPVYGLILCIRGAVPGIVITKVKGILKKNITSISTAHSYRFDHDQENTPLLNY